MTKFIHITFFILTTIFITIFMPTAVYALETCAIGTDPTPLLNNTPKAKFIISVANLGGVKTFTDWAVEFKCGAPNKLLSGSDVKLLGDDKIYVEVNNGPGECVFHTGTHEILVKGVVSGTRVDQCIAQYFVKDAATLCELSIRPDTGIISTTPLTVSGKNLAAGGRFSLFVDNTKITSGFVSTPSFSGLSIPTQFMTPGSHKVDLREFGLNVSIGIKALSPYGSPLCNLGFRVGTPDQPGSVSGTGPQGIVNWIPGISSFSKKEQCDSSSTNPGIKTAIGCVHTSPLGFAKDFLKFIIAISGGLAFLMMLLGAFQMLTSRGNPEALHAGQERLTSATIGLLFVILSVLLLRIIGVDILGLPGFGPR